MRKTHFTAQEENDISLIMEETGISRKSAIRKLQRRARLSAVMKFNVAEDCLDVSRVFRSYYYFRFARFQVSVQGQLDRAPQVPFSRLYQGRRWIRILREP